MATWQVGKVTWFFSSDEKQAAAAALYDAARWTEDVFPTEWKSDDGEHMLLLEHHC